MRFSYRSVAWIILLLAARAWSQAPAITSLAPATGPVGIAVTITGSGFGATKGSSSVKFAGIAAKTPTWSDTSISATVPANTPTGLVNVKVLVNGVGSNEVPFTVLPTPVISGLSSNAAAAGDSITIAGTNFGAAQGSSTLTFNGTAAVPSMWSATSLVAKVPQGASTGHIVVTVNGISSAGTAFIVLPATPPGGVAFVQGNYATPGTTQTPSVPYVAAQHADDLNVVIIGWSDTTASVQSVTDTTGNVYQLAAGPTPQLSNGTQAIYYAAGIAPALPNGNTISVLFTSAATTPDIRIAEYSGIDTTNPLDVSISKETNGTLSDTGVIATTNANDLLIGANLVQSPTTGPGTGYNSRVITTPSGDIFEDRIVTATGNYSATAPLAASARFIIQMVAFREAANHAPVVNAGPNQTITLPANTINLAGTAIDDGLPINTLTITWSELSGPATVVFSNPASAATNATFSVAGVYVLQLTANDSQLSSSATMTVTVNPANQPPVVSAGPNQTITLPANAVTLSGSATDDGLPAGSTLQMIWSMVSGPAPVRFVNAAAAGTTALFGAAGIYDLRLTASDSQLDSSADVTITVNPPPGTPASASIVLSPASAGPIAVGTAQQMQAAVVDGNGVPIANASVTFAVTGANQTSGAVTTNASGIAIFTYTGAKSGVDAVLATSTVGILSLSSNTSMINWAATAPGVTLSPIAGQFFTSDGSGTFNTAATTVPAFSQTFSSITFNPPAGSIPGTPASIDVNTRPFTAVLTDANGTFSGSVVAQGNGLQAGVGTLSAFQAVFTGTLSVAAAGNVTFNFFNADGFIFGVSNNATRLSGTYVAPPSSGLTAFKGYPVMGAFNTVTGPVANSVTVHFPAAGAYSYELDYAASNQTSFIPAGATWKYSLNNPAGFEQLGFDDSGFALGAAPFTNVVGGTNVSPNCPLVGKTLFPVFGVVDLRKIITLPGGVSNVSAYVAIDNDFTLWVNGVQVTNQSSEGCAFDWNRTVPIPDNLWFPGDNLLAVQARDRGVATGFDLQLTNQAAQAGAKQLTLTMAMGRTNGQSSVTLSPSPNLSLTLGQAANFTALVTDVSGAPAPNAAITLNIAGVNAQQLQTVSDANGLAVFTYHGIFAGNDIVQAQTQLGGSLLVSSQTSVTWNFFTNPPPTGSLTLSPASPPPQTTGQVLTLTAKAVDGTGAPAANVGVTLLISLANTQQINATTDSNGIASFSYSGQVAGTDTIQAVGNIGGRIAFSNIGTVSWTTPPSGGNITYIFTPQGWIGSPIIGAVVQGQVPITVAPGISLTSGTLKYFPTSSPSQITILNANTTGGGTLGTFDATLLANGQYTVQLQAINSAGAAQLNEIVLSVVGQNKPGRVTATVTDLEVPLAGIPVMISRTYDSLERGKVEDFGFGWALATTVDLEVDALKNVSLTVSGKRQTFYFTPQGSPGLFGWLLSPKYTPQAGAHGALTSDGCGALIAVQGDIVCFPGFPYQPATYFYTDPAGRTYTIASTGQLHSIQELNGNILSFTPAGITSSVGGISVPFVRDSQGRITQITDLNNNIYSYSYDAAGNLASVLMPGVSTPKSYTYTADHLLLHQSDPLGNTAITSFYSDGRLQSLTDPAGNVTQFAYNIAKNTITTTNPDLGVVVRTNNSFGNPLSITDPLGRTTTYTYDAAQNLPSQTDPLGNTSSYTYDANGFQTSETDPLQHTTKKAYDRFGNITSRTDALGNTTTISYDAAFNPVLENDSLGQSLSGSYDAVGNVVSLTNANGKTTLFAHDANGNITSFTDPLNRVTRYSYDAMDLPISKTDPRQNTTRFGYDALGHLTSITDANNKVTQLSYDAGGRQTAETDALQRTTAYQYDADSRLLKITYPDQTTRSYTYDFRGNMLTETDQLGHVAKFVYDRAGQLKSTTYAFGTPDAATVSYTYDLDGRKLTETDARGNVTTYGYDAAGRLASVKNALGKTSAFGHDANNRLTSITDANQHTTPLAYDVRRRLTSVTYPDSTTKKFSYDGVGNQLTATDRANHVTTKAYDDVNRLIAVTNAIDQATGYSYDPANNLASITDANQHVTSFQYDNLNRLTTRTLPLGMSETRTYDAAGNMTGRTDFNGKTTTLRYDALNRLLQKVPDASLNQPAITFTYSATGKRTSMLDASGTTTYNYDNRDRLTGKATPEGTLTYTYDAAGNVASLVSSHANGASMSYTYDALNRLASVIDRRLQAQGSTSVTTSYNYDPAGNLSSYIYPNGVQTSNIYDTLNRLVQIGSSQGGSLSNFAYSLEPEGHRLSITELGGRAVNFGYDGAYRLASEAVSADPAGNNGSVNYSYDPAGNRKQINSTLSLIAGGAFSYDANDRLTSDTYDGNGNTLVSAGVSRTYDFENRLLQQGGASIVYDGDGNRVAETVNGLTTTYLLDDLNPTGYPQVIDELLGGSVTLTYTYGRQRISQNQIQGTAGAPRFYGYDGQGNVRIITNASGAVTDTYSYSAFGSRLTCSGSTLNEFQYSGEQSDSLLGLYYLRARYYNPPTGRFMTMDPASGNLSDPPTFHRYLYTRNDPVNRIDPTGRQDLEEFADLLGVVEAEAEFPKAIGKCDQQLLSRIATALSDAANGTELSPDTQHADYEFVKCIYDELLSPRQQIKNVLGYFFGELLNDEGQIFYTLLQELWDDEHP